MIHLKNTMMARKLRKSMIRSAIPLLQVGLRGKFRRSSYMQYFESLKEFPYKFENTRNIIPQIKKMDYSESYTLIELNDMLDDSKYNLRDGFTIAYQSFLNMIKDQDSSGLGMI
mmetsp:Transcript_18684/g.16549  ORF Transcript_18684/g.16549 Transcript_18684/m.16549 type:complete len:114 (+) Transcript_18684:7-348(+)